MPSISYLIEADLNQSFRYHSRVLVKHKAFCITVPKVACSRLKLTLHQLEGNTDFEHIGMIHDKGTRLNGFNFEQIQDMVSSPEWYKFCFVRNPYERLVSAYNTQIGNTWNSQYDWVKQAIRKTFDYPDLEANQLVAFRDFVRYLPTSLDEVQRDGHFNLQSRILMPELISYDFIGRFERFTEDLEAVLTHLRAAESQIKDAKEVINPTYKVQLALVYDRELADSVYELYKPDFEHFGYERNSWMLES